MNNEQFAAAFASLGEEGIRQAYREVAAEMRDAEELRRVAKAEQARREAPPSEAVTLLSKLRGPPRSIAIPATYEAFLAMNPRDAASLQAAHPDLDPNELPTKAQLAQARKNRRS